MSILQSPLLFLCNLSWPCHEILVEYGKQLKEEI